MKQTCQNFVFLHSGSENFNALASCQPEGKRQFALCLARSHNSLQVGGGTVTRKLRDRLGNCATDRGVVRSTQHGFGIAQIAQHPPSEIVHFFCPPQLLRPSGWTLAALTIFRAGRANPETALGHHTAAKGRAAYCNASQTHCCSSYHILQ